MNALQIPSVIRKTGTISTVKTYEIAGMRVECVYMVGKLVDRNEIGRGEGHVDCMYTLQDPQ